MPRILLLLIILAVSRPATATVGLKAGASFASLRGGSIDETYDATLSHGDRSVHRSAAQTRAGVVVGATIATRLAIDLEVRTDVLYVQKGADFSGYSRDWYHGEHSWAASMRLDYLELPVSLRLTHPITVHAHFFLEAGFYAAALLDARYIKELPPATPSTGLWDEIEDGDFGGILGAGLEGRFQGRRYALELRYTPGFVEIQSGTDAIRNTGLALTATMTL